MATKFEIIFHYSDSLGYVVYDDDTEMRYESVQSADFCNNDNENDAIDENEKNNEHENNVVDENENDEDVCDINR